MKRFLGRLRDFIYGFFVLEPVRTIRKIKFKEDSTLMIVALGDMLGIPITPPIYKYRLLAYWIPIIDSWKREMLREKDIVEKIS